MNQARELRAAGAASNPSDPHEFTSWVNQARELAPGEGFLVYREVEEGMVWL
ncbi:MAG: hypothetical protein R6U98_10060 [Pirellulaceae bacterium]